MLSAREAGKITSKAAQEANEREEAALRVRIAETTEYIQQFLPEIEQLIIAAAKESYLSISWNLPAEILDKDADDISFNVEIIKVELRNEGYDVRYQGGSYLDINWE